MGSSALVKMRYEPLEEIGRGSFGVAIKVRDLKDRRNKIKVMKRTYVKNLTPEELHEDTSEGFILSQLNHPHIVKLYESFFENDYFYVIVEYCEGGDLSKFLNEYKKMNQKLGEHQILNWFSQLVSAFVYLHAKGIMHRDVKSKNIFIKESKLKIGDFGLSKNKFEGSYLATCVGSPAYFSPELCKSLPYNSKSDIWALGILLYEMCTFEFPFKSFHQTIYKDAPNVPDEYSKNMNNLFKIMVIKEQQRRASIGQIADFLERYLNVHIDYYDDSYLRTSISADSVTSSSPEGSRAITLYDCHADDPTELTFDANAILTNVHPSNIVGWYMATNGDSTGLVPGNYIRLLDD